MARRLQQNLNSDFIAAANRLGSRSRQHVIVAYVESYDDVFFWNNLLQRLATPRLRFEVMLPSRTSLSKGKKTVLSNALGERLGSSMIACVDADYDWLLQGATEMSREVCENPYVFHTYAYAIENLQCYAPTLQGVCVSATLNANRIFPFEAFLKDFSETVWPLFCWNVWAYRYGKHKHFTMLDFYHTVVLENINLYHPEQAIKNIRNRVNAKIARLHKQFPEGRTTFKPFVDSLLRLGLTPQTTYLYMRGHDLFDGIVSPILSAVCESLRREREREIRRLANHETQMQNELSAYRHALADPSEMLRKQTAYEEAEPFKRTVADVAAFLSRVEGAEGIEEKG